MTHCDTPPRQAESLLHVLHRTLWTRHVTKRCGVACWVADNISNSIGNVVLHPIHCIYCTSCLLVCNTDKSSSQECTDLKLFANLLKQMRRTNRIPVLHFDVQVRLVAKCEHDSTILSFLLTQDRC